MAIHRKCQAFGLRRTTATVRSDRGLFFTRYASRKCPECPSLMSIPSKDASSLFFATSPRNQRIGVDMIGHQPWPLDGKVEEPAAPI
jgi:hypothetical protein